VDEGEEMDTFIMERAGRERERAVSNAPSAGWINLLHANRVQRVYFTFRSLFLLRNALFENPYHVNILLDLIIQNKYFF
jgi:hypothetical protein